MYLLLAAQTGLGGLAAGEIAHGHPASRERHDQVLEHRTAFVDDLDAGPGRDREPHDHLDSQEQAATLMRMIQARRDMIVPSVKG